MERFTFETRQAGFKVASAASAPLFSGLAHGRLHTQELGLKMNASFVCVHVGEKGMSSSSSSLSIHYLR